MGVTVIEAIGHGRQRGITHEYRGRVFESRFLPKAHLMFIVSDDIVDAVISVIATRREAATSPVTGSSGRPVFNVIHNRTGTSLEEVEVG